MKYEFHPEALDEYEDAARYYAGCQAGLELRFINCVESALRSSLGGAGRSAALPPDPSRDFWVALTVAGGIAVSLAF